MHFVRWFLTKHYAACILLCMNSIDDLFKAFGGTAAFGRVIGKRTEHAGAMKNRQSVPLRYWPALISSERGREIGLTSADLMRIHAARVDDQNEPLEAAQ